MAAAAAEQLRAAAVVAAEQAAAVCAAQVLRVRDKLLSDFGAGWEASAREEEGEQGEQGEQQVAEVLGMKSHAKQEHEVEVVREGWGDPSSVEVLKMKS